MLWLVDQNLNLNSGLEVCSKKRKFGFLGGESGCDFCMLFCNFFSTMPSVERLIVVMVQDS